jgi:hypothetical protein
LRKRIPVNSMQDQGDHVRFRTCLTKPAGTAFTAPAM